MIPTLCGTIEQSPLDHDGSFISVYWNLGKNPVVGNHGATCWWFPFAPTWGLKIFNSKSFETEVEADYRRENIWKRYTELRSRIVKARKFLPTVYTSIVVQHYGACEWGGSNRHHTFNNGVYYACMVMKPYKIPTAKEWDRVDGEEYFEEFLDDGFLLHSDSFRRQQVGIADDSYVLLDIADRDQKKWL